MDQTLFNIARNETPEVRTEFLRKHLFKSNGAVPTDIPTATTKMESEEESAPPREYGKRTIKGKLPPEKFPPARRVINTPENQSKFEKFLLQDIPTQIDPISIPEPITQIESDEVMQKKKSTKAPSPSDIAKGSRGVTPSPASQKAFDNLSKAAQEGKFPTHKEYQKEFGKLERTTFYSARMKLQRIQGPKKNGPTGRGIPAKVFSPPAGGNGNGRAHVEIIYSSDENPEPAVMKEVERVIREVLAAFAHSNGMDVATTDLQIKNFAPSGWEIRRAVK